MTDYYYHVYNRGVNKRPIFKTQRDYRRFVLLIRFYKTRNYPLKFSKFIKLSTNQRKEIWIKLQNDKSHIDIITYCLMPNHFHFLLKQNSEFGISKFLGNIQNSHARYFNIKTERIGPLFQGQFKTVKIDSEEQLLHVSRYIHLNPFSSAIVADFKGLENYEWSSLKEYTNQVQFGFCSKDIILNNFKNFETYKKFVFDNADYQKELENIKHLILEK